MPGPRPTPVHGDETLPARVDVVVIGGGIIGSSTALELAERGIRVALCEKGGIGHEQSSRNWGWVRISRRDPREVPLMAESLRIWKDLDTRTSRETGYRKTGIAFVCGTEKAADEHESWRRHLEPFQIESRMLRGPEMAEILPNGKPNAAGILFTPADGRAEPQKAAPAIAEAARDKGAVILTECAVRAVETEAGRISGVVTERGTIACDSVVLAGGAWSNLFCGNAGIDLPQLTVVNHVVRTRPLEGGPEHAIWTDGFAIRKRLDGGYSVARGSGNTVDIVPNSLRYAMRFRKAYQMQRRELHLRIGPKFVEEARRPKRWAPDEATPFEYTRVLDPKPSKRMLRGLMDDTAAAFPVFRGAEIAQTWAGCIDVTPDAIPVISPVDDVPGFFIATGFSGHGFGIGPGAGRLMADLVTGATPCVDPHEFRLSRFTDGSVVAPDEGF